MSAPAAASCCPGSPRLRPDLRLAGIDLRPRPESLPAGVDWAEDLWDVRYGGWTTGQAEALLVGNGPVLVCG